MTYVISSSTYFNIILSSKISYALLSLTVLRDSSVTLTLKYESNAILNASAVKNIRQCESNRDLVISLNFLIYIMN